MFCGWVIVNMTKVRAMLASVIPPMAERLSCTVNVLEISAGLRLSIWLLMRRGATTASW